MVPRRIKSTYYAILSPLMHLNSARYKALRMLPKNAKNLVQLGPGKEKLDSDRHGFIESPRLADKKYEAIIFAVAHDEFKAYSSDDYEKYSSGKRVVIDIKNIVENPTWKL